MKPIYTNDTIKNLEKVRNLSYISQTNKIRRVKINILLTNIEMVIKKLKHIQFIREKDVKTGDMVVHMYKYGKKIYSLSIYSYEQLKISYRKSLMMLQEYYRNRDYRLFEIYNDIYSNDIQFMTNIANGVW